MGVIVITLKRDGEAERKLDFQLCGHDVVSSRYKVNAADDPRILNLDRGSDDIFVTIAFKRHRVWRFRKYEMRYQDNVYFDYMVNPTLQLVLSVNATGDNSYWYLRFADDDMFVSWVESIQKIFENV